MPSHFRRIPLGVAATLILLLPAPALADNIYNEIDSSIDTTVETLPLNAGSNATVSFRVQPLNGDGKQGCNLTGQSTLTVDVISSDTDVATALPSSLTFSSCDSAESITVHAGAAGSSTFTLVETARTTTGTFDFQRATFEVRVSGSTNQAPAVAVTGFENGATYELGDPLPVAGCSATDPEDGASQPTPVITDGRSSTGVGTVTVACSYTDRGGLTASSSASYSVVDTTPPAMTLVSRTPAANGAGWNTGAVTVTWQCTDLAGVSESTVSDTVSTEGLDQTAQATCTDLNGNTTGASLGGINIDTTAPGITWVDGPADGSSHYFGAVPAAGTCTASDGLSGPDGCAVTGYGTSVGPHTLTATAHDVAGNESSQTRSYEVRAWTLSGFHQPVDMNAVNTVKNGSTVPLKFEVFAGDSELTSTSVVASFTARAISCTTGSPEDAIEMTSTGGTSLRYDTSGGQFIQNWQTPKKPGSCYQVTMTTQDGSSLTAGFRLK